MGPSYQVHFALDLKRFSHRPVDPIQGIARWCAMRSRHRILQLNHIPLNPTSQISPLQYNFEKV